jgi:hypothetical protein
LLLVVEPHQVRAWTCCNPPLESPPLVDHPAEIETCSLETVTSITEQVERSLSWIRIASGEFFERHGRHFVDKGRADRTLLENLRHVRKQLTIDRKLDPDIAHDLLARLIFIQFLFDRTDSRGRPALSERELVRLHQDGVLSTYYQCLGEILRNRQDTYRFFRWLNDRFNGDLFPGHGRTHREYQVSWRREEEAVRSEHLELLADFIKGRIELGHGQRTLWRMYSFDVIPLEFISSIYEEFAGEAKGIHYTPSYLVDFVLDGILPWDGNDWDLKILDPACGSGIFLVKTFQRLVHRWRKANPGQEPRASLLQRLLERNLFGVDADRHAVRAASFSLYLAMCDEIDPRHYWQQIRFPTLRGRRLVHDDFFNEREGIDSENDAKMYDLVIGNAPWGKTTSSKTANRWARKHNWTMPYKSIGPLFLAKAALLTKEEGHVSMLQPATSLLFNRDKNAVKLRRRLINEHRIKEIVNFTAIRFRLFNRKCRKAKSPACLVTFQPAMPDGSSITYICPKPQETGLADSIIIEPNDVHAIDPNDADGNPWLWTVLLWGGPRDLELIRRLRQRLSLVKEEAGLKTRFGIMRGQRTQPQKGLLGRRILEANDFPEGTFMRLKATSLPINQDKGTAAASSTTLEPFNSPQLLIRRSWKSINNRFHAALVITDEETGGVLCMDKIVTVHASSVPATYLEAACLSLNSKLATYFLILIGNASFSPYALKKELLEVPIPEPRPGLLEGITSFEDVDRRIYKEFSLKDTEQVLIDDFFSYYMPLRRRADTAGQSQASEGDPDLEIYSAQISQTLRQAGGTEVGVTIFRTEDSVRLPFAMVAVHLDFSERSSIQEEVIETGKLLQTLLELNQKLSPQGPAGTGGVFFHRTARVYDVLRWGDRSLPTVYIIKPAVPRYWTSSDALRDADEIMADALASTPAEGEE